MLATARSAGFLVCFASMRLLLSRCWGRGHFPMSIAHLLPYGAAGYEPVIARLARPALVSHRLGTRLGCSRRMAPQAAAASRAWPATSAATRPLTRHWSSQSCVLASSSGWSSPPM